MFDTPRTSLQCSETGVAETAWRNSRANNLLTALRHLICVVALMWTGLVNGQPFFFATDSTNYVRAADAAMFVVTHGKFSTVWSDRYKQQLQPPSKAREHAPELSRKSANDLGQGVIMAGRSPYIGGLMYLGYLTGDFWPFVLFQALVAYALIILTLRRFNVAGPIEVTTTTLVLAATTSLPMYNSLLLADAFASFGIVAFLLFASPGKLSKWEQAFLGLVLVISMTAHLTHIMMLAGMTITLALIRLWRLAPKPPRRAWVAGIGGVLIGLLSIQLTAEATKLAFGRSPQLLPLLTARFIADGPGAKFIKSGCDQNRFEICHRPIGDPTSDALILFGDKPENGAYMLGDAEQRTRMGKEDLAFALAVLKFDPPGQIWAMARNTVRQLLWIDYGGLNQGCWSAPDCWQTLPADVRMKLKATPSGRGDWPQRLMNTVLYAIVLASLVVLAVVCPTIARTDRRRWSVLRTWLLVGFAAMLVCCCFGGAVADPQYRYQGRLIWLVPLMAAVALLIRRKGLVRSNLPASVALRRQSSAT